MNTYPEINATIVDTLRISQNPVSLYAAQRIEELELEIMAWRARDKESEDMLRHQQKHTKTLQANLATMTDKAGDEFERAEAAEARVARLMKLLQANYRVV